ncbi:MAG: hypothetical protein ACLRPT_06200 [Akkermansia muciniphila]
MPEFNRLALEGRIAGGKDGIILAEDGNQNVLVGQIVTRIWPAATGDASVDKQRFERVEVPLPWSSRETASSSFWGRIRSSSVNPVPGAASC